MCDLIGFYPTVSIFSVLLIIMRFIFKNYILPKLVPFYFKLIAAVLKTLKERFSNKNMFNTFIVILTGILLRYFILKY